MKVFLRTALKVLSLGMVITAAAGTPARAQSGYEPKYDLGAVVVTPTKTETYQAEVGSSTSVIAGEDIKKTGRRTVHEVLRDIPGVSVRQTGAFGGTTSVYLRGANPGQTLVLIDGVEVNDPMSADRSFDFAHLTTDNIERIEVVRGPQSTLYGSDAMAGVINIITKKGEGKPSVETSLMAGSHNTRQTTAAFGAGNEQMHYNIYAGRFYTGGISQAASGTEDDEYKNTTFSARAGMNIGGEAETEFVCRYTRAVFDIDDFDFMAGTPKDDPNYTSTWEQFNSKLELKQNLTERWDHRLAGSFMRLTRKNRNLPDAAGADDLHDVYIGDSRKIEWQNNVSLFADDIQTLGLEYEEERGMFEYRLGSYIDRLERRSVDNKAAYLQSQMRWSDELSAALGLRLDRHQLFGTQDTYKISPVYFFSASKTAVKANWATGFKAPSIYQLYSSFGDEKLNPEESRGYDFGVEQQFLEGDLRCGLAWFRNDFKNLIDWDWGTWKYVNIGRAKTSGVETQAVFVLSQSWSLAANYTYLKTEDKQTGLELAKRPRHKAALSADWKYSSRGTLSAAARYIGKRWDDTANTQQLKPYTVVDVSAHYDIAPHTAIFGEVVNLFDRDYEEVRGYNTLGRSFFGGVKGMF